MHIVFIISSLTAGGAERVLCELANHFVRKTNKVSLIELGPNKEPSFYTLDFNINLIQLGDTNFKPRLSIFDRIKNNIKLIIKLRNTIKNFSPDLIISFIDVTNIKTLLASFKLNIPVIVSERIDPNYHNIPKLYQYLRLITYSFASKIIVQTPSSSSYFSGKLKNRIKIIPNAVKRLPQLNNVNRSVKHIISIGRLALQKDHKTLIKSFAELITIYPELYLTIYGEGPSRFDLEKLIVALNLQNKVKLPGITKDYVSVLANADLFVFSSLYEGFPNALSEAMAIGLPVIASNCSGNIDIIQDRVNGRLFTIGDVNALTTITKELINDFKQREQLASNARKITEQFSEERIYKMWEDLVQSEYQRARVSTN